MAGNGAPGHRENPDLGIELVDPDLPAGAGTEALDLPPSDEGPRQSSALITAAALVVAVAVGALLVSQGETPPSPAPDDPSTTEPDDDPDLDDGDLEESPHPVESAFRGATQVRLSPIEVDRLARDPDLLIAPTPNGYVVIDAVAGTADRVDLGATPIALAPAESGEMFAHGEDRSVAIVTVGQRDVELMAFDVDYFAPSAERGGVWLRFGTIPNRIVELDRRSVQLQAVTRGDDPMIDPRYRIADEGDILDLTKPEDERLIGLPDGVDAVEVVGVDAVSLIGTECLSGVCVLRRIRTDITEETMWWDGAPIRRPPDAIDRIEVSPDGRWLVFVGDELSVQNEGGLVAEFDAWSPQFSADGDFLYLLGPETLTILDLETSVLQTAALPAGLFDAMDGWIVVERPTE